MVMQSAIIKFTDSAEEELSVLNNEMRLWNILQGLQGEQNMSVDLKSDIQQCLIVLADLFSTNLPAVETDPVMTLLTASRDYNLGRLLRERGTVRLYRLIQTKVTDRDPVTGTEIEMPFLLTQTNPETGDNFKSKEEFIGWFCHEAHVSRPHIFQRMAVYDKLQDIGMTLEEAFTVLLKKPYAIQETLNMVASWDKGKLVDVQPFIADRLATKMLPDHVGEVEILNDKLEMEDDLEDREELREQMNDTMRPALKKLVMEVADHPSVRDAMDFVRHDIVSQPEIKYRWNHEDDTLEISYISKAIDPNGTEYIEDVRTITLSPESDDALPSAVRADLMKRLPIVNRV